jgi:transposase
MPRTQPPYAPEFRQQIVELAKLGQTPSEHSREFGVAPQTVTNWVAKPPSMQEAAARPGRPEQR